MRNPSTNKSNNSVVTNKILVPEHIVNEVIRQRQSFQKSKQIPNLNNQRSSTGLFKKFRDSAQLNEVPQSFEQNNSKLISQNKSRLLKITKKQETFFEPNSSDIEGHKENGKLQLNSKKFIHSEQNNTHSKNRLKNQLNQQYHLNHQMRISRQVHPSKPMNDQSFNFGYGLQGIGVDTQGQLQSTFPQKSYGLFGGQKGKTSFQKTCSIFTPIPSNISASKKFPNRVSEVQMRSTGRNFFKRPLSLTASLKTAGSEGQKGDKRQAININTSINPFRANESRGMAQIKRSSSQQRNLTNSFKIISQIVSDSKNRWKKEGPHLSLANNLNRLLFKYNGGYATTLYNYRLKIKNESSVRLSIKIKCTSPRSYQVRPSTETVLNPSEILSVSIELKLFTHDLNHTTMKHDLSRYRADKFKIIYWTTDHATQEDYFDGERVLPVVIEQTAQERARNIGFEQNLSSEKVRQATEEKEIQMYKKLIEKDKQKLEEIDGKISILNSNEYKHKYFSKHLFWLFAIFGIALGFWLG